VEVTVRPLVMTMLLAVAACRSPSSVPKQAAFDFTAHPGPGVAAFSSEANLLSSWNGMPAPLRDFWSSGEPGTMTASDGATLVYRIHRAASPKASVVLLPGRTEAIIKYAEVARDLVAQGYSTYALTLRGQGEASRLLSDPDKGYVAWFEDYVSDTKRFLKEVVRPDSTRVFMLAHSTGGLVGVLVADEEPDLLDALALSDPMLEINLGAYPPPVAATLAGGVCSLSDGTGYVLGGTGWQQETDVTKSSVTGSLARFTWKVQQQVDDPSIRLGDATWRWLCQSLDASGRAQALGAYNALPTLLLQAANDTVVKPGGENRYCADAPRCTKLVVDGAKHEILQEVDGVRNLALSHVVAFFDAQVTP
jgi:lysophospholipase